MVRSPSGSFELLTSSKDPIFAVSKLTCSSPSTISSSCVPSCSFPSGQSRSLSFAIPESATIRRASANRTVLYTTHNVGAARDADRIVVMAHGRIVEQGSHAELLSLDGAYASLLGVGDGLSEEEASSVVDLSLRGATCEVAAEAETAQACDPAGAQ